MKKTADFDLHLIVCDGCEDCFEKNITKDFVSEIILRYCEHQSEGEKKEKQEKFLYNYLRHEAHKRDGTLKD